MAEDYDHNHYYKSFMVKREFLPDRDVDDERAYLAVDYAYHYCSSCGETIKVEVKEKDENEL